MTPYIIFACAIILCSWYAYSEGKLSGLRKAEDILMEMTLKSTRMMIDLVTEKAMHRQRADQLEELCLKHGIPTEPVDNSVDSVDNKGDGMSA